MNEPGGGPRPSHGATRRHAGKLGSGFSLERGREEIPAPPTAAPCPRCPDAGAAGCERTSVAASAPPAAAEAQTEPPTCTSPDLALAGKPGPSPGSSAPSSWLTHSTVSASPAEDFSSAPCNAHKHSPRSTNAALEQVLQVQNSPRALLLRGKSKREAFGSHGREPEPSTTPAAGHGRGVWAPWAQAPLLPFTRCGPQRPAAKHSCCCETPVIN